LLSCAIISSWIVLVPLQNFTLFITLCLIDYKCMERALFKLYYKVLTWIPGISLNQSKKISKLIRPQIASFRDYVTGMFITETPFLMKIMEGTKNNDLLPKRWLNLSCVYYSLGNFKMKITFSQHIYSSFNLFTFGNPCF